MTARQELKYFALPLVCSGSASIQPAHLETFSKAQERYQHLVEEGRGLLAEYFGLHAPTEERQGICFEAGQSGDIQAARQGRFKRAPRPQRDQSVAFSPDHAGSNSRALRIKSATPIEEGWS